MEYFIHVSSKASVVSFLHPTQFPFFVDVEAVIALCEKYDSYRKVNNRNIKHDINDISKFAKLLTENYRALLEEISKQLETPLCYYP